MHQIYVDVFTDSHCRICEKHANCQCKYFVNSALTVLHALQLKYGNKIVIFACTVRHYFALATSPGEQFNYFVSLAAWLLRSCGRKMDQPQEVCDKAVLLFTMYCNYCFQFCHPTKSVITLSEELGNWTLRTMDYAYN